MKKSTYFENYFRKTFEFNNSTLKSKHSVTTYAHFYIVPGKKFVIQTRKLLNQLRNRIDIFCSTSVRSRALQKSSKEILPWQHKSASKIVRSAMLISWSWLIFAPTIMWRILNSSSRLITPSSSRSYILNATKSEIKFVLNPTENHSVTHFLIFRDYYILVFLRDCLNRFLFWSWLVGNEPKHS